MRGNKWHNMEGLYYYICLCVLAQNECMMMYLYNRDIHTERDEIEYKGANGHRSRDKNQSYDQSDSREVMVEIAEAKAVNIREEVVSVRKTMIRELFR